ncbi:MAG TPA: hypothetical protein P5186_08030 [Candidatus Paceibacterota bacterium]|nr:hypothetical protein [Candidatus Paceibacterota bacterium]
MKKTWINLALSFGLAALFGNTIFAQQILVSREMENELHRELTKPISVFTLDQTASIRIDSALRAWVAARTDLATAPARNSQRFPGRMTYALRKRQAGQDPVSGLSPLSLIEVPILQPIFFRTDLHFYTYRQFPTAPALSRLENSEAIQLATDLLVNRQLVELSQQDVLGESVVRSLNRNSDTGADILGHQELLMQGVVFRRLFRGAPVLNSRMTVDLQPDTGEIMGLKHVKWTPALPEARVTTLGISSRTANSVLSSLEEKAVQMFGRVRRITLSNLVRGWFQTDVELLPILLCQMTYQHDDHQDGYTQPINLAGGDEIFYSRETTPNQPSSASEAELVLSSPQSLGRGAFSFIVTGPTSAPFVIEAAADLPGNWIAVATNTLVNGQLIYEGSAHLQQQYFRARIQP